MNTSIWKYDLFGPRAGGHAPRLVIKMQRGAKILCVHEQGNVPKLWAAVDPHAGQVFRKILVQGTGDGDIEKPVDSYIGSAFLDGGMFVFHFFDEGEVPE